MIASPDEAKRLVNKWKTENSLVKLLFSFPFGGGSSPGFIVDVTWPAIQFVGVGHATEFALNLGSATFEYAESREAPPHTRESARKYPSVLVASFGPHLRINLFEMTELPPSK